MTWKDLARWISGRSGPPVSERCWRSAGLHGHGAWEVRKVSSKVVKFVKGWSHQRKRAVIPCSLFHGLLINHFFFTLFVVDCPLKRCCTLVDNFCGDESSFVWERYLRLRQVIINLGCLGNLANSTLLPFDMPCLDMVFWCLKSLVIPWYVSRIPWCPTGSTIQRSCDSDHLATWSQLLGVPTLLRWFMAQWHLFTGA